MSTKKKSLPESIVRQIKRKTRRKYSAEDKIQIVLEGLRGEQSITDLYRRNLSWHLLQMEQSLLEAGKQRLTEDTVREAGSEEVTEIRTENKALKQLVAELSLNNRVLKKTLKGLE